MSSQEAAYQPKAIEVKTLRDKTGLPMMDCKKALVETRGDVDQAIDTLRKQVGKFQMDASGRETSQGRIDCYIDGSGDTVSIVQMQCEQAPSAKNENFVAMTKALAKTRGLVTRDAPAL